MQQIWTLLYKLQLQFSITILSIIVVEKTIQFYYLNFIVKIQIRIV